MGSYFTLPTKDQIRIDRAGQKDQQGDHCQNVRAGWRFPIRHTYKGENH